MKKKHPIRKGILIFLAVVIIGGVAYKLISDYISSLPKLKYTYSDNSALQKPIQPKYPQANFAVMSDLHYYDVSLGTEGAAFEKCMASDRKLLTESAEIINFAVDDIIKSGVKFVLVPGDLTKDGELIDHKQVVKILNRLKDNGIQAYVVPGNHDVNNGISYKYEGDNSISVPNVSATQFADLYKDFGYAQALYRHSDSLSYVVEPVDNLWLISIDAVRYNENISDEETITDGKFTQSLETWLEGILKKANELNKPVMVMVHQGIVEHWKGQSKLHPEYLLDDYTYISKMLASYGVRMAFTGHYHAQDIAKSDFSENGFIIDMETGSLVTPSCPLRYCMIDSQQKITVTSKQLAKTLRSDTDFEKKGTEFVNDNIVGLAYDKLRSYGVNENDAKLISESVGTAFIAHYNGDEDKDNMLKFDESKLTLWSKIVFSTQRYVIDGLRNDTSMPKDNNCIIDLATGNQY